MDDFYEPDEPVEDVKAAFEQAEKGSTAAPNTRRFAYDAVIHELKHARLHLVAGSLHVVAVAARLAGLRMQQVHDLEDRADLASWDTQFDIQPVELVQPVGFRCEHMTITAGGGTLSRPVLPCGCEAVAIFA